MRNIVWLCVNLMKGIILANSYVFPLFIVLFQLPFMATARDTLHASVSPEFPNGLHSKYLQYLAHGLDMTLVISPMPFARRVQALCSGDIDIMVGLQQGHEGKDGLIYLYPNYEQLSHSLFILKKHKFRLHRSEDLRDISVAITIDAQYFDDFYKYSGNGVIKVSTLEQKISLLQKGRIDAFIHFKESAMPLIKQKGLSQQIVLANYQPTQKRKYYVAISTNSNLLEHRDTLTQLIKKGIATGEFAAIRTKHYAH